MISGVEPQLRLVAGAGPGAPADHSLAEEYDRRLDHSFVWLITILGVVPRALFLNRPSITQAEAELYWRAMLPLGELMELVRAEGTLPLLDLFYWGLARTLGGVAPLNVWVMRIPAAVAGALMTPAVFWLASAVVSRRCALLVAGLTAASAWLLGWSRSAEPYMALWLMAVVNVAALLAWLRRRDSLVYFAWIASGAVMMGLSLAGTWICALNLLIAVTYRRPRAAVHLPRSELSDELTERAMRELEERRPNFWERVASGLQAACLLLVGLGIILSGVTAYRLIVKPPALVVEMWRPATPAPPAASGPVVVVQELVDPSAEMEPDPMPASAPSSAPAHAQGQDASLRLRQAATSFLIGWEPPAPQDRHRVPRRALVWLTLAAQLIAVALALGLIPWREKFPQVRLRRPWELAALGRTTYSYTKTSEGNVHPQPLWRGALWLGAWIVLPTYALYCASSIQPAHPVDWARALPRMMLDHWMITLAVMAGIAAYGVQWTRKNHPVVWRDVRRTMSPLAQLAVIALLLLLACSGIHAVVESAGAEGIAQWSSAQAGLVWPALMIVVAVLLMRIRFWKVRPLAILIVLAANLAQAGAWLIVNPGTRIDLLARDVLATTDRKSTARTYVARSLEDDLLKTAVGRYYLERRDPKVKPRFVQNETQIARDAAPARWVEQVVVWDTALEPIRGEHTFEQVARWRLRDEVRLIERDHWSWRQNQTLRQRIFTRGAIVLSTQPVKRAEEPSEIEELERRLKQMEELGRQLRKREETR